LLALLGAHHILHVSRIRVNKFDHLINIKVKILCACALLNNKDKPVDSTNMHPYPEIVYADK